MKKLLILPCGLILTTLLGGVILSGSSTFADGASTTPSVIVQISCNIASSVDREHVTTTSSGHYEEGIGTTTFNVFCNDGSGYDVYAIGYSGNELGNNNLIATIGGQLSPSNNIATGTATSGNTSNWAMKLESISGTYAPIINSDTDGSFASYHKVPSTNTKVASFASSTDSSIGSSFQSTYATYIDSLKPAGIYTGMVKYTLVHPNNTPNGPVAPSQGCISYLPNAPGVSDTMDEQCLASNQNDVDLWASNFQRANYGFAGWNTEADGTGTKYGPNEEINDSAIINSIKTDGLVLYAMWVNSAGTLQNWSGCSSLGSGKVTALTDQRDGNTYTVAKLADGKCWMTENLRLDNTASHNSDGALAQGYNSGFIGLADPESSTATTNTLYSNSNITSSNRNFRFPRYNNQNTSSPVSNMTEASVNVYGYGNYYTWAAAVASIGDHTTDKQSITNTSICPSGWHLPTSGSNTADFDALDIIMGGDGVDYSSAEYLEWRKYPANFLISGNIGMGFDNSATYRGQAGFYWSSTVIDGTRSYSLVLNSAHFIAGGLNLKNEGRSVRCISNN